VAFACERGACDHRGIGSDFGVESTEGIMTAAIEQQEQPDHEHIFGKGPPDVVNDAVKALAASPLNPAADLDNALNTLDACVND
jgi:hypothetical protein